MTHDAGVPMTAAAEPPEPTTVASLLRVPELRLSCVESGQSLEVSVRWIHSTELLDPAPYLRGGELVCTVGSSIHTDVDAQDFVAAVQRSAAAAICFGVGDVHRDVPTELRSACREAGLPLLSAPLGVPFMAIGEYVAERRAGRASVKAAGEQRMGELLQLVQDRLALPAALESGLVAAGLDPDRLVFSIWPAGTGRRIEPVREWCALVIGEGPHGCTVVSGDTLPIEDTARRLRTACGHSRVVPLADAAQALREAAAAFELAQRHGGVVTPGDLTSVEGLLAQQPADRLTPFVDRLLEPLLRSDRVKGTHYMATLRTYIETSASLAETARREFLHVNTVRHRLEQIRELSGRDPFVLMDRMDLVIAMWTLDHLGR